MDQEKKMFRVKAWLEKQKAASKYTLGSNQDCAVEKMSSGLKGFTISRKPKK